MANDKFQIADSRVKLPKIGWVAMREPLRFSARARHSLKVTIGSFLLQPRDLPQAYQIPNYFGHPATIGYPT